MTRLLASICLASLLAVPAVAQDDLPMAKQVDQIFARMNQAEGEAIWDEAIALEKLGSKAGVEIARRLDAAKAPVKVAAAKALLSLSDSDAHRSRAIQGLKDVIRGDATRPLRVRACDLLAVYGMKSEVSRMTKVLDTIHDPIVKIHLLVALRQRGRYRGAERALKQYLNSESFAVRSEAALALAEIGNVDVAKAILAELKDEPTPRGRRAQAYLKLERLDAQLERFGGLEKESDLLKLRDKEIAKLKGDLVKAREEKRAGTGGKPGVETPGGELFDELFKKIRATYVDGDKTRIDDLVDAAASGLVDHLDPFSSYMNEKSLTDFNRGIGQRYGGIGAVVQMDRKTGYMTIQRPIYGNPAYLAGLRTLDQVTEVEGVSTKGKTIAELVAILKGPPNTPVTVKVIPFLGGEERPVQITRKQITLKSTRWDMLPGKIGYLQLSQFGHLATDEVEEALIDLESRGMQGLIFDLRGNPGGLLAAAVEISDKFLDDDQLVVYSEGRKGTRYGMRQDDGGPSVRRRRLRQPKHPDYPLVVLVDENAASASEIVAGALQAHNRAELVGMTTFGKGSVQNIFRLESMDSKAALRMTIAYYYLPDGRCIHKPRDVELWRFQSRMRREIARWKQDGLLTNQQADDLLEDYKGAAGGVEPDYRVEAVEIGDALQRAYGVLYEKAVMNTYIKEHWGANKKAFLALAHYDGFDGSRYPGFDALWAKCVAELDDDGKAVFTKNDLRVLVRATVRRFAQDEMARTLTSDYQEDTQLQAALLVLTERVGTDVETIERLAFLKDRFPEGVARTRKVEKPDDGKPEAEERDFK
jgi:carboxyl-terminal processing protease